MDADKKKTFLKQTKKSSPSGENIKKQKENFCKLSSKNMDRLFSQRGLSQEHIEELKASMDRSEPVIAKKGHKGEKFVVTGGKQKPSGIFVSEESLGKTPEERIDKAALPTSNTAEFETKVELLRDQILVKSKIKEQPHFEKVDLEGKKRSGGGYQIITDGGYKKEAIGNKDPKYPTLEKEKGLVKASEQKKSQTQKR